MCRTAFSLVLCTLAIGCDATGFDASLQDPQQADADERGWWWMYSGSADEEAPLFLEPGDPGWFNAHCDGTSCIVTDDFDARDWLEQAQWLCQAELGVDEPPRFQRVGFTPNARVDADAFRASDSAWVIDFTLPDPDDLWGYRILECTVDITGGVVTTDVGFGGSSVSSVPIDQALEDWNVSVLDLIDSLSSFDRITSGGVGWISYESAVMIWINDATYGDHDDYFASTGERDW